MNYTLHQLQIFLEVVKQKSITKAANQMNMSQPALSIQLKNFQSQFDVPLSEIIGKQIYITDFGNEIAHLTQKILDKVGEIDQKTQEYKGVLAGKLKIASVSTGKYVIPYFLSQFLSNNNGIELTLDVSNKSNVLESLLNNEVDFALVSVLPDKLDIYEEVLLENKLYLVGNSKELDSNKPLIYREHGSATRLAMEGYFGNTDVKSMNLTSNEAVKQALIAGLGNSILPLIGIKNELFNNQLQIIQTENLPIVTNWRLIWLKKKKLSAVSEAYLNFIRSKKYEIIQNKFEWFLNYK